MLAFHNRQPRFANWLLEFRFGEASEESVLERVEVEPESPAIAPVLEPVCEGREEENPCWRELPEPEGCYVWNERSFWGSAWSAEVAVTWTGAGENGLATGSGILTWDSGEKWERRLKEEGRGSLRDGKKHGHWLERIDPHAGLHPETVEGPYVDGKRHGHWVESRTSDDSTRTEQGPYVNGKMHGRWVGRNESTSGRDYGWETIWQYGEVVREDRL